MLKLQSLFKEKADEGAFFLIIGVAMMIMAFAAMIFLYFFIEMIARNIIWIALAIVLVIAIPILAKAYFTKTTGKMYPEAKTE